MNRSLFIKSATMLAIMGCNFSQYGGISDRELQSDYLSSKRDELSLFSRSTQISEGQTS